MAVGGAAYHLAKAIKAAKGRRFADLNGAIYEFDVRDVPVTVAGSGRHQRARDRAGVAGARRRIACGRRSRDPRRRDGTMTLARSRSCPGWARPRRFGLRPGAPRRGVDRGRDRPLAATALVLAAAPGSSPAR